MSAAGYPDHHAGVRGEARGDDPLLTTDGSLVAARLMWALQRATLVGNAAPIVTSMRNRMDAPVVGDAVVVIDATFWGNSDAKHKAVGYLVAKRAEWLSSQAEWDREVGKDGALSDRDRVVERAAWYVQYGPNPVDICRWTNCDVVAIP